MIQIQTSLMFCLLAFSPLRQLLNTFLTSVLSFLLAHRTRLITSHSALTFRFNPSRLKSSKNLDCSDHQTQLRILWSNLCVTRVTVGSRTRTTRQQQAPIRVKMFSSRPITWKTKIFPARLFPRLSRFARFDVMSFLYDLQSNRQFVHICCLQFFPCSSQVTDTCLFCD